MTPTPVGQTPPTATVANATPLPPVPTATPVPPATTSYIVRPGDTLSTIAVRFRTTVSTLAQMNNIVNRDLIYYGQRLNVPTGAPQPAPIATAIVLQAGNPGPTVTPVIIRTYRVQTGDNLFNIALRFSVPLSRLTQYNGILNPNRIFVGQVIVIP
jgi:LysM repeat protein